MFGQKAPESIKDELQKREKDRLPGETNVTNPPSGSYTAGRYDFNLEIAQDEEVMEGEASGATSDTTGRPYVENTIGTVHIKKPSFERVFFLLRPLVDPVLKQFTRVEQQLSELVKLLTLERVFIDRAIPLSQNVSYELNFLGHKYLYIMTLTNIGPQLVVGGNILPAMQVGKWYPLVYQPGTKVTASGVSDASPVTFIVRACDVPMAQHVSFLEGISGTVSLGSGNNLVGQFGDNALGNGSVFEGIHDNNDNITLLASASYAVGNNVSTVQTNQNGTGVYIFVNITVIGTGTVTLHIQGIDPANANNSFDILLEPTALAANGVFAYVVNTGIAAIASPGTAGGIRQAVNQTLPRSWRINAVVATAAVTMSVTASTLSAV